MMLFVLDKDPIKSVEYLIKYSNKNFVFKQLLELGQLVCSAGISDVYKKISQGKELQKWVKDNSAFGCALFCNLMAYSKDNIKMLPQTYFKLKKINNDYFHYMNHTEETPKTAIFRYNKNYKSQYKTNSELLIDKAIEEYKKYLKWKFEK